MRSKKIIVATVAIGLLASSALVAQLDRRERTSRSLSGKTTSQQELVSGTFECSFVGAGGGPGIRLDFAGTADVAGTPHPP